MTYSFPEIKQFQGLALQQNSFTVQDGYLEEASNAVVSKDNILSKRRGFYNYYTPNAHFLNNIYKYQDRLVAIYNDQVAYYNDTGSSPNETGSQQLLTGQTISVLYPRVSRSLEVSENFYFTTDTGPLKLTAYNSAISASGAPQGLDLLARFISGQQASWLSGGNIVGYRVVFGYRDNNSNLILGAPSDIATISNALITGSTATVTGTGPYTITITQTAHGLTTGMYLTFSNAAGFTTPANANGLYQITVLTANTFSYQVPNSPAGSGTISYAYAMPVRLEFSVPSDISTSLTWFYQIYRSSQQQISVGIFSDFKLLQESNLSASEISAKVVFFTDDLDDILLGAELYTNENSREGELQANFRPPLSVDVAAYKGYAVYANCTSRQLLSLSVVDPTAMVSGDYVEVKVDLVVRRYVARTGVGNRTVRGVCTSSSGLLITYALHGLLNGDKIYIANVTGGTLTQGFYYVINSTANTFQISLTSGGSAIAYNAETSLDFQGVDNGTYPIFYLSQSTTASVRLRDTAQGLVKAIDRDTSSLIYAQYISGITDIPGRIRLQAKGFVAPIYLRTNTLAAGTAFSPTLPDSFASGPQVFSTNDNLPNCVYISKFNEPEAVPLVNFIPIGSKNKAIIRVHALRDSLIILKEDGAFRLTGDNINNFTATLLDGTVQIVASSSSDVLNNQVVFLSNQGICLATESSVQVISRTIEDVIQPILGQADLSGQTSGVAYESERLYILTTTSPNDTTASVVYVYNFLTNAWTTWDNLFIQGVVGPADTLYLIDVFNNIVKERKKQTKLDYTGQNFSVVVSSLSGDLMSASLTLPAGVIPSKGDIVVKNKVINRIEDNPVLVTGDTYLVEFGDAVNLINGDSVTLYSQYKMRLRFAPFHAGLIGRMKAFSQMQIHMRENSISRMTITFQGDSLGISEVTDWRSQQTTQGWGLFPWGYESWGQTETINLTQGTRPAPIIRTYVPLLQSRVSFIQPVLEHAEAGEQVGIQALSYAVRAYGERVSR